MTFLESSSRSSFLFEHDLFRKPLHTFRDHALVDPSWSGGCRPGRRQRHGMGRGLLLRIANVPLAHAMAAGALGEIHMHVILVIAVGTGTEHGGEARANGLAHAQAIIL